MKKSQLQKIIQEEVKAALREQSNPELDKMVSTFVKGLATKYQYDVTDALYAIFQSMTRLGYITKVPADIIKQGQMAESTRRVLEGAMSDLDILMDESRNFQDFLSKVKSDPKFKSLDVTSPDVVEFLQGLWNSEMEKGSSLGMAAE
jgi:hypothetical protein